MDTPNTRDKVAQLGKYIEENLRASQSAGLKFVDPHHFGQRLMAKQNHVVFGRRGAGKSTLVSSCQKEPATIAIYLNLETYKDITFPNIIVQVLLASFRNLRRILQKRYPWYLAFKGKFATYSLCKSLERTKKDLAKALQEPDEEEQQVLTKSSQEEGGTVSLTFDHVAGIQGQTKKASEIETARTVPKSKLNWLRLELTNFTDLFSKASNVCNKEPIFLVLDDFYFVSKTIQPDLLDYFHRITKDTNVFLKVATIKHRSRLYRRSSGTPTGVELGHDIYEIDMDYTLDDFDNLKSFMKQLLESANSTSKAGLDIDTLFEGDGFAQLCLASGGVPRDFLSLFVTLATEIVVAAGEKIGKVNVTEQAISRLVGKLDNFKTDSGNEGNILEIYLNNIKKKIYQERRTNAFLVGKQEMETYPQARQAIQELIDLRLIHQVEKNTSSAPSDGLQYEAYILDISLYDNPRPRSFEQIEPGMKDARSRKDKLRAAPKLSLGKLEEDVESSGIQGKLTLSKE